MDKRTYNIMLILLAMSFIVIFFNVSSEVLMELPFGLKVSGDLFAVIPTGILAYFIYKEYKKKQ